MRPQPCVRNEEAHKRSHHGHTGITRHSPRNGFNGFFRALPGDRAFLPPSPRGFLSAKLDASVGTSGPHDFAVRDQHRSSSRYCRVHRIPRPTSVTIAIRPSCGPGWLRVVSVIWVRREDNYFCARGWTAFPLICPSGKIGSRYLHVHRHCEERERRSNPESGRSTGSLRWRSR
jgi:hypothetical protein